MAELKDWLNSINFTKEYLSEDMRDQKERKELLLFNYGIEGLA